MKWLPSDGSTQRTSCGRYVIVQATSQDWVAYDIGSGTTGREIGSRKNDADARALCEAAERAMLAETRKRA
jgi:hypothetical protein